MDKGKAAADDKGRRYRYYDALILFSIEGYKLKIHIDNDIKTENSETLPGIRRIFRKQGAKDD